MSELVDQIAKLETKANQLKDSVSDSKYDPNEEMSWGYQRRRYECWWTFYDKVKRFERIEHLQTFVLPFTLKITEEILRGPEKIWWVDCNVKGVVRWQVGVGHKV